MMKTSKRILGILGVAAGIAAVAAGIWIISYARNHTMDRTEALQYALADAGLEESDVTITQEKLERDDGKPQYEIEFYSSEYMYEYEIDAVTGEVLGVEIGALFAFDRPWTAQGVGAGTAEQSPTPAEPSSQQGTQTAPAETVQDGRITVDDAKAAALADAGVTETEVTFTKTELDYDDGIEVYEIEFYASDTEYEYEINAVTGAVVSRDTEIFRTGTQTAPAETVQDGRITVDDAKAAALADAGVTETEVTFTKTELDYDDGIEVYEIEFYIGRTEYEYEINAATGAVVSRDVDH